MAHLLSFFNFYLLQKLHVIRNGVSLYWHESETLCCGLINNKQSLHVCNLLIKIRISIIVFFQMKIKEKPEKKIVDE